MKSYKKFIESLVADYGYYDFEGISDPLLNEVDSYAKEMHLEIKDDEEREFFTNHFKTGLLNDYRNAVNKTQTKQPRRAVAVLKECIDLMERKGSDYNNVPQARYYENNGLDDIYCMMHHKMLRIKSVMDVKDPNFDSLQDSCRDLINYTSFFVEYLEGKMEGQ
jgi:hypothetical protein